MATGAGNLTYAEFADEFPELATSVAAEQAKILVLIKQAERYVDRDEFSDTVQSHHALTDGDFAVLLIAAHLRYVQNLRLTTTLTRGQRPATDGKATNLNDFLFDQSPYGKEYLRLQQKGQRRDAVEIPGVI